MGILFSDDGESHSNGDPLTDGPWVIKDEQDCLHKEYTDTQKKYGNIGLWLETEDPSGSVIKLRGDFGHQVFGKRIIVQGWFYDTGGYIWGENSELWVSRLSSCLWGEGVYISGFYGTDYRVDLWPYMTGITRSVGWHLFKIIIKEDGGVDFYVDDTKSAVNHEAGYFSDGVRYVCIRSYIGEAFFDNITVSETLTENATLTVSHNIKGGYNIKQDDTWIVDKTLDVATIFLHSLKYGISKSHDIIPTFSGKWMRVLETTLNVTPEIHSILGYGISRKNNILSEFIGNREVTRVITPSNVGNLLSYRVTQEWQAPYDIAELRYKSIPNFEVGDYIRIEQEDFIVEDPDNPPNKIKWVIFRGPAIGIDKTYKKNFEETTIKAVSNEWYLTKQFCFWDAKFTQNLSFLQDVNGKDYVIYFLGGMHPWSNFTDKYGLGDHWEWITGIDPQITSGDIIPDWESNWKAYTKVFNFPFGKRKLDAIRDLCHNCDYAFYCLYGHDSYNWGRRFGYFQHRDKVYNNSLWPFGVSWRIDIDADEGGGFNNRLIEIRSRESQTTDDTKINRVAMGTQISLGEYFLVRREQDGVGTYKEEIKPVEEYQGIQAEDWADLTANSSELYDTLRKTNITYEAKLLSLVSTYPHETPMCPGMQIRFKNVEGHPEDTFRIKKITHERGSGDPIATTTIEYQDFDLIKGGSPKLNEIESILNNEENKIEKGDKILGYPSTKDPRSLVVGEKTGIDVGEVTAYNESENTVDIKIYSTNQIVEGIPVV